MAISRVWWSPISGLSAETSSSGPFWRASLRRQKSRSKLEEGRLIARVRGSTNWPMLPPRRCLEDLSNLGLSVEAVEAFLPSRLVAAALPKPNQRVLGGIVIHERSLRPNRAEGDRIRRADVGINGSACEPSEASRLDGDIDHAQQHVKPTKAVTQGHFFQKGPSAGVGAAVKGRCVARRL